MKKFIALLILLCTVLVCTACARDEAITVYNANGVEITRSGSTTTVKDTVSGEVYKFTTRRTKRSTDAREATKAAAGGRLDIELAFNLIRVDTGSAVVYVKCQ